MELSATSQWAIYTFETYLVNLWQSLNLGSMQNPEGQTDHLQIFASSGSADVPGLRPDIINDCFLQPRDQEMCALIDNLLLNTRESIEYDCPCTASHIVHGRLRY